MQKERIEISVSPPFFVVAGPMSLFLVLFFVRSPRRCQGVSGIGGDGAEKKAGPEREREAPEDDEEKKRTTTKKKKGRMRRPCVSRSGFQPFDSDRRLRREASRGGGDGDQGSQRARESAPQTEREIEEEKASSAKMNTSREVSTLRRPRESFVLLHSDITTTTTPRGPATNFWTRWRCRHVDRRSTRKGRSAVEGKVEGMRGRRKVVEKKTSRGKKNSPASADGNNHFFSKLAARG